MRLVVAVVVRCRGIMILVGVCFRRAVMPVRIAVLGVLSMVFPLAVAAAAAV